MTAGDEITVKLEKIIYHADRFEIVYIMDLLEDVLRDEDLLYRELIENAMDAAIMFEYENIKKYISLYLAGVKLTNEERRSPIEGEGNYRAVL